MIKIGIVGIGGMGTVHYNNYLHIEDCKVCGFVSHSGKDKAAAWGLPAFDSIAELVHNLDVDVIDICTPTFTHAGYALEALSLNKNVIVEKPCALSEKDAAEMFSLARERGRHVYVAQVLQFSREIEVLRKLVQEETYGKPLDAVFQRLSARPEWARGGWLFDRERSGLVPYDLHIHDLDVIASLFGVPESAECYSCGGADQDFKELYRWEYRCGAVNVAAEAAWLNASIPFTSAWRVYFERAAVICSGSSVVAYPYAEEPVVFDTEEKVKIPTGINVPPTGWYLNELSHFVDCVRKDIDSPLVPENRVLAVLHILEQTLSE